MKLRREQVRFYLVEAAGLTRGCSDAPRRMWIHDYNADAPNRPTLAPSDADPARTGSLVADSVAKSLREYVKSDAAAAGDEDVNDDGAPVVFGTRATDTYYCNRRLGTSAGNVQTRVL